MSDIEVPLQQTWSRDKLIEVLERMQLRVSTLPGAYLDYVIKKNPKNYLK